MSVTKKEQIKSGQYGSTIIEKTRTSKKGNLLKTIICLFTDKGKTIKKTVDKYERVYTTSGN